MNRRPPDALKPFAARLAELLDTEDGAKALALMRTMGVFDSSEPAAPKSSHGGTPSAWVPEIVDGETHHVFKEGTDGLAHWTHARRIGPKRGKRVVYFGESVARGYFYDPYFNPAMMLKSIVSAHLGNDDVEIVDLARSDIQLRPLMALAEASAVLQPDAYVFFAGNNFRSEETLMEASPVIARLLRSGGSIAQAKVLLEQQLAHMAGRFMQRVGQLSKATKAPAIVMIPEFNLVDWVPTPIAPVPFLPEGRNAAWEALLARGSDALAKHEHERAEGIARELIELDGGISAASLTLLSKCQLALGDKVSARRTLEALRDCQVWNPFPDTPRCYRSIQDTMRKAAAKHEVTTVDLPARFAEYAPGEIADRRLFHDYCHLTSEGIRVAMASVAEVLIPTLGLGATPPWSTLGRAGAMPTDETEAEAHFLAALHNSTWGQPYDVVLHNCEKSARLSPKMIDVMRCYLDFQFRAAPNAVCTSFDRLHELSTASVEKFLTPSTAKAWEKLAHPHLITAIIKTLQAANVPVTDEVWAKHENLGIASPKAELVQNCHWSEGFHQGSTLGYYRSHRRESRFSFTTARVADLQLAVTYRVPDEGAGELVLEIDGRRIASLPTRDKWQKTIVSIPKDAIKMGMNLLVFRWPVSAHLGEGGLERIAKDLELSAIPNMYPILGEVHSLRPVTA